MINRNNVPQLTKNGLKDLMEKGRTKAIFQLLEIQEIGKNDGSSVNIKFRVTISDGDAKFRCILGNEAARIAKQGELQPYAVIQIIDNLFHDNKGNIIIITRIEVIHPNIIEQIGNPIAWSAFSQSGYQNPGGSNQIPAKFLSNVVGSGSGESMLLDIRQTELQQGEARESASLDIRQAQLQRDEARFRIEKARFRVEEARFRAVKEVETGFSEIIRTLNDKKSAFLHEIESHFHEQIQTIKGQEEKMINEQEVSTSPLMYGQANDMPLVRNSQNIYTGLENLNETMKSHFAQILNSMEDSLSCRGEREGGAGAGAG